MDVPRTETASVDASGSGVRTSGGERSPKEKDAMLGGNPNPHFCRLPTAAYKLWACKGTLDASGVSIRPFGETGKRGGLKSRCRMTCRFESDRGHQPKRQMRVGVSQMRASCRGCGRHRKRITGKKSWLAASRRKGVTKPTLNKWSNRANRQGSPIGGTRVLVGPV